MLNLENYKDISSYVYLLDPKDENYDSRIIEGKFLRGGKDRLPNPQNLRQHFQWHASDGSRAN